MKINADFKQRVVMKSDLMDWVASPVKGVDRKPLDRLGEEVARATSFVRFAQGSQFSEHIHGGGEEFFVLEGVFQDEYGDFPAGSYIRNPPASKHTPGSASGCIIFVKLWQFDKEDRRYVRLNTNKLESQQDESREGVQVIPLFQNGQEVVRLELWAPGVSNPVEAEGGAEVVVLDGELEESGEHLKAQTWLRTPVGYNLNLTAGPEGARLWIKSGHLSCVEAPSMSKPV